MKELGFGVSSTQKKSLKYYKFATTYWVGLEVAKRGLSSPRMDSDKEGNRSRLKELSNKPTFRILRDQFQKVTNFIITNTAPENGAKIKTGFPGPQIDMS